jgi:beta-glucanase (GH16 family)
MTLEDWDRREGRKDWHDRHGHRGARKKGRSSFSKRVPIIVLGIVIITAGLGMVAKAYLNHSANAVKLAAPSPKSLDLKFDSKFTGDSLDTHVFGTCYPWVTGGTGCTNYGNKTDQEKEWYLASQDHVSDGVLSLIAQRQPTAGVTPKGSPEEYACRSGMITTYPSFRFEYGYVQVVAKIPFGNGLWSALWLAAANEKWPPEIDLLEHWHSEAKGAVFLHPLSGVRQGGGVNMPSLSQGYHTFSLEWTPTELVWYYDGQQVSSTTTGVPHQSMYLIANLADDSLTPGSCSGSMVIKSIKVWQPAS